MYCRSIVIITTVGNSKLFVSKTDQRDDISMIKGKGYEIINLSSCGSCPNHSLPPLIRTGEPSVSWMYIIYLKKTLPTGEKEVNK